MPNNMPDARAINEALRRAREMQSHAAAQAAPAPDREPAPEADQKPPQERQAAQAPPAQSGRSSPLDLLLQDKERTLILALLILLSGEGGNTELLFALMYLLI